MRWRPLQDNGGFPMAANHHGRRGGPGRGVMAPQVIFSKLDPQELDP